MDKVKIYERFNEDCSVVTEVFAVRCYDGRWRVQHVTTNFQPEDILYETLSDCVKAAISGMEPEDLEWRLVGTFTEIRKIEIGVYARQVGKLWGVDYRVDEMTEGDIGLMKKAEDVRDAMEFKHLGEIKTIYRRIYHRA